MALRLLRIFLTSPGDVAEERLIARRVIGRIDAQIGEAVQLEAVFWEHEPLVATASFQEQLTRPSESDIVVAILWSRLGTVLPGHVRRPDGSTYASGTEFEFEDAIEGFRRKGKPEILVYRKTAAPAWPTDSAAVGEHLRQKQALDQFIARWFLNPADGSLKAAFHSFGSPADFEELLEAHLMRLVQAYLPPGSRPTAASATWRQGSPFRGLQPFESEHAAVFFGRTAAAAAVLMKLRLRAQQQCRFLLVVGMSGGGKSSLVRAGVLPLLVQPGVVGDAKLWRHAIMRPADGRGDLVLALAEALVQPNALPHLSAQEPAWIEFAHASVARSPTEFAAFIATSLDNIAIQSGREGGQECHLALFVDQIEEIFSDDRVTAAERETFVAVLDALSRNGKVWVLATLRSDVYPRLAELPGLIALKEGDGQFDLLPPNTREIGQIIRLPALAAGLRFEVRTLTAERLDETIRDAAAANPGALPLLQFLLEELYKRRSDEDVLTFRAYEELGGVEGALARRAEEVLAGVSAEARNATPIVFRELVALGVDDESKALRRVAPRDAFTTPGASELVDALLNNRLLVSALDAEGHAVISLAHEALLDFWPRLREWRERNRENLHVHARLAAAANRWQKEGRSPDFLLARGKPIAEARALIGDGVRLRPLESALVAASEQRARRFQLLRASAVAVLAILAGVASIAAWRANLESERARVQATTAQRTTDFMVSLFEIADPEENRGETVTVREILDKGVAQIRTGLSGEQVVRANLLRSMGQAYNGLGLYPAAHSLLLEAVTAASRSGPSPELLRAQLALAANRYVEADYKEAEVRYRHALTLARQLHGDNDPTVSEALTGLGDSLFDLDRAPEAETLYRQALDIDLRLHGEQHADTARTLSGLGSLLYLELRYSEAEPLMRRALAIRRAVFGERHAKVGESANNLATLLYDSGRLEEAATIYGQTLQVYRTIFGPDHPEVASLLNNVGRIDLMLGRLAPARVRIEEALAIDKKVRPAGHDDLIMPLNSLAMIDIEQGQFPAAQIQLKEALTTARARHHAMLYQVLATDADLSVRTGQTVQARAAMTESRAAFRELYGEQPAPSDTWRQAVLDSIEGSIATSEGRFDEAGRLLHAALPPLEARYGVDSLYPKQTRERLTTLDSRRKKP